MILGLSGYAGSGKDAIADRLVTRWGWRRAAFADPIRRILERVDPVVGNEYERPILLSEEITELGWDVAKKNPEVRRLMQALGDACREEFLTDVFVVPVERLFHEAPSANWVVADVRTLDEAASLREYWGATLVRVVRPGVGPVNDHGSETELDDYNFDDICWNNGTLEDLHRWVDQRVESGVWG